MSTFVRDVANKFQHCGKLKISMVTTIIHIKSLDCIQFNPQRHVDNFKTRKRWNFNIEHVDNFCQEVSYPHI